MKEGSDIGLKRDGQSQLERFPAALDPAYAKVDSRTFEEYLDFAKQFAKQVRYFNTDSNEEAGDWSAFFQYDSSGFEAGNENVPPHLALFYSFLKNFHHARNDLNAITDRHLDFYYKRVLGLREKDPVPDKAHVVIELKKNTREQEIPAGTRYKAGKDGSGKERLYEQRETLIANSATIESLRSVFIDKIHHDRIHMAPIAGSPDGLGGEMKQSEPQWSAFGHKELPKAQIGFAFSSPLFCLQEGVREVDITLQLSGLPLKSYNHQFSEGLLHAYLSGEEGWIGPKSVAFTEADGTNQRLMLSLDLAADEPAVTAYNPVVHGGDFTTDQPIIQFVLNNDNVNQGYGEWKEAILKKAKIDIRVRGIKSLSLENDNGVLDAKKPFFPFGNVPTKGSVFYIGYPEAFEKKLNSFALHLDWKDAPSNFKNHYAAYQANVTGNNYFTADVHIKDGGGWNETLKQELFTNSNASFPKDLSFSSVKRNTLFPRPYSLYTSHIGLNRQNTSWALKQIHQTQLLYPLIGFRTEDVKKENPRSGFISIQLNTDFLHKEFRELYPIRMMEWVASPNHSKLERIPKEPYTPVLQSITMDYHAYSNEVDFAVPTFDAFASNEIQLFHIGAFGQMREHGYQKHQFESDPRVFLLPQYRSEGEFYIGLSGLEKGQGLSLLFQVAEGSGDPETDPPVLNWQVLVDNYWRTLTVEEVISDTTNGLLNSGIIQFNLPNEANLTNSILPAGYMWLRCLAKEGVAGLCRLKKVVNNAVVVDFIDQGNDSSHASAPLPADSIVDVLNKPGGVKSVSQPFASFGGASLEDAKKFRTRISERLRHKNRAVSLWDYERLLLNAFPELYKVKCIPHASASSYHAPGHVMIVLIPDLNNQNAVDHLRPKVSNLMRERVYEFLMKENNGHVSHFVTLHVVNPTYERIQLDFQVKFRPGFEFSFYVKKLEQEIREYLSPWAYGNSRELGFEGLVYRSVLLDFVEERNYVDFVTEFKMYCHDEDTSDFTDLDQLSARSPRSILVSHEEHIIHAYTG